MESFPPPAGPVALRERLKESLRTMLTQMQERRTLVMVASESSRSIKAASCDTPTESDAHDTTAPSKKAVALVVALALIVKSYFDAARESPQIYAQRNAFTECVMALLSEKGPRSGIQRFRPGVLTFNGHADTFFSFLRAHPATIPSTREQVPTPDGGHFALDWYVEHHPN